MFTVGKIYLLVGGHLIRYRGDVACNFGGYPVIREITAEDARMLRVRYVAQASRKLYQEAAWTLQVMSEVEVTPPKIDHLQWFQEHKSQIYDHYHSQSC